MYTTNQTIENHLANTQPPSSSCGNRGHEILTHSDPPLPAHHPKSTENETRSTEIPRPPTENTENATLPFSPVSAFFRQISDLLPSTSTFKNLDEHQHERLLEWLRKYEYQQVRDFAAAKPPEGFDIKCTISSLWRYSEKIMPLYLDNLRQIDLHVAAGLDPTSDESLAKMEAATLRGLRHRLFKMSIDSSDPLKIRSLYSVFHKLADQNFVNRRIVLLEKRAQQADQTEQLLRQPLPPEERHRRLKQIFGLQ